MNIAICIVAYNRLDSLKRCISFLEKADYPEPVKLYISVDKSNTTVVEDFAKAYHWEHGEYEAILHDHNLGLRTHILGCGDLLQKHDALCVIEDDVAVAQSFYCYAKACVEKYHDDTTVAGISLYSFVLNYQNHMPFRPMPSDSDVYLMQNAMSWGQVWMKNQWTAFKTWYETHKDDDFYANPLLPRRICKWKRSWLKFHTAYCIMENKYFIHPYTGYTTCFCDAGEHNAVQRSSSTQNYLLHGRKTDFNLNPTVKYDTFFENEGIYEWLSLPKESLCLDFYGVNRNIAGKRYYLTTEKLPYKILNSWGLVMRPYEANVLYNIEGKDLYLYDTSIPCTADNKQENFDRFMYLYGTPEDRIACYKRKLKSLLGKR